MPAVELLPTARAEKPDDVRAIEKETSVTHVERIIETSRVHSPPREVTAVPRPPPPPRIVEPAVRLVPESDRRGPAAAAPPAAPTIQVTIGRIDIRAAPPPPPPQRVAGGRNPGMGLEEYLRRRDAEASR
jgi:hypothetical protein